MTFKRIYIKFNNGAVFTYMDPDGFICNISSTTINILVQSSDARPQQFNVVFPLAAITFYRYEQTESGHGTEQ